MYLNVVNVCSICQTILFFHGRYSIWIYSKICLRLIGTWTLEVSLRVQTWRTMTDRLMMIDSFILQFLTDTTNNNFGFWWFGLIFDFHSSSKGGVIMLKYLSLEPLLSHISWHTHTQNTRRKKNKKKHQIGKVAYCCLLQLAIYIIALLIATIFRNQLDLIYCLRLMVIMSL